MSRVPLVVVGAGPAGLSTALFLQATDRRLAERLVVLEAGRFPRDKICAGAVGGRADHALARIGVTVDVPSAPIRGIAVSTQARTAVFRLDEVAGRVVRRIEFDAELARIARARGIDVREGATVRAITTGRDGLSIAIDGGDTIEADAVVGADGVRSIVRRSLGFDRGDIVAQVAELDTTAATHDHGDDVLHFDLRARRVAGYAWDFPTPLHGALHVSRGAYVLRHAAVATDPAEHTRARLPAGAEVVVPTRRFSERAFVRGAALSQPRAILVGEAAGIDPVLGEGIAQAILGGEVAARYLAPRLARMDHRFDDWAATFASTSVGRDLARRAACFPYVYGAMRDVVERHVVTNGAIARAGLRYFAGMLSRESVRSWVLRS